MSASLHSPPSLSYSSLPRSLTQIRASTDFSSSLDTSSSTELDYVSSYSDIVPDPSFSIIWRGEFSSFWFPRTAATISSSLVLGICSLSATTFKALVNVGGDLAKLVPGQVPTEVDACLAYDTHDIVRKAHDLLTSYNEIEVPLECLLFKIPSTWQGIEASSLLEYKGLQTHLTFVYSFCQAAAAAQIGASVIQIFVGHIRDWARNHSGDPEIKDALKRGKGLGLALDLILDELQNLKPRG